MNCNLLYHLLSGTAGLLPDRLSEWVNSRWLAPHVAQCARCRTHRRRLERLEASFRCLPATEAVARAMAAPRREPIARPVTARQLYYTVAGGTAVLALAALLVQVRPGESPRPFATARPEKGSGSPPTARVPTAQPPRERDRVRFARTIPHQQHRAAPTPGAAAARIGDTGTGAGARGKAASGESAGPVTYSTPDEAYLDGRDPSLAAGWMAGSGRDQQVLAWLKRRLPPIQDDFVRIPFPQLASTDPKRAPIGEAVKKYEKEAAVVDARLFRKVTLELKAVSLADLCANMATQTGVRLQASRGVQDEKATVLVTDRPARDVMREIARLFGYFWARSGDEGAYKYELSQDLRAQLAEEEMRSRDVHAALIALDEELAQFKPYLERTPEALRAEYERIQGDRKKQKEAGRLSSLFNGAYGPLLLYFRLAPAERAALFAGEWLRFGSDGSNPDRRLPEELRMPLLTSSNLVMFASGTITSGGLHSDAPSTPIEQVPGAEPEALLHLDRSEAGDFSLEGGTHAYVRSGGKVTNAGGFSSRLATGRSPSAAGPGNAAANAALRKDPRFLRAIELKPKPSCPRLNMGAHAHQSHELYQFEAVLEAPHVTTADVWEEIHARTGLPVVADSYTHLYPLAGVTSDPGSTFDALCKAGDAMGVRWKKDGDFLLARSTTYFWDKVKEVPNRLLEQWKQDSVRNGGLPLADLLEMAGLSDQQLGSRNVGLGITHCWGLDEWGIIGGGPFIAGEIIPEEMLRTARDLRVLGPGELETMQQRGLPLGMLAPEKLRALAREFGRYNPDGSIDPQTRATVDYVPSGWYVWRPTVTRARYEAEAKRWPLVYGRNKEEVLARARRYDPDTEESSVRWTRGRLDWGVIRPDGVRDGTGGVRVKVPLE